MIDADTCLLGRLPSHLFAPLAGPNRGVYADVLLGLYPLFFEHEHHEIFPSRETVRAEIEELVSRMTRLQWTAEEEDQPGEGEPGVSTSVVLAQRVYRRLLDTGWLEEEQEGYRVRVVVPPDVGSLLGTLVEIGRQQRVFYGGMVLSIYNNVRNAVEAPESQALAFREASRDARRFSRHLNNMVYGLKGLLKQIAELVDRRLVLGHFFDDFVERFLVADYKRLKTRNNPFRYRSRILSLLRDIQFSPELKGRFQAGYQAQMDISDPEAAWREFDRDLRMLSAVFEQIDGHLDRIDRYRYRFERRVADTIRYLDRTLPGMAPRCARLVERLTHALTRGDLGEDLLCETLPLAKPLPLGLSSLRPPSVSRQPPEPTAIEVRHIDPALLARQRALRAYVNRRRIDVGRIVDYLERHLRDRHRVDGEDLTIETVEDFIAFAHVRHLPYLGAEGRRAARQYSVRVEDGLMENVFVRCPRFSVSRKQGIAEEDPGVSLQSLADE